MSSVVSACDQWFSRFSTLFSIDAVEDPVMLRMDLKTAFLNGDFEKNIIAEQLVEFASDTFPDHVCY